MKMEQNSSVGHRYERSRALENSCTNDKSSQLGLPFQTEPQNNVKDWRPGFIRRVTTWSDSISNRHKRSKPDAYRTRYLSESQSNSRSASSCSSISPDTRRAASVQERQTTAVRGGASPPHQGSGKTTLKDIYTGGYKSNKIDEHDHDQLSSLREGVSATNLNSRPSYGPRFDSEPILGGASRVLFRNHSVCEMSVISHNCNDDGSSITATHISSRESTLDTSTHPPEIGNASELSSLCVGLLDSIFQGQETSEQYQNLPSECVKELMGVVEFMFAAQSYHDCFKLCQQLWSVVGHSNIDYQTFRSERPTSLWLPVAVNMVKSAQSPDEFLAVAQMMESMPRQDEWPEYYKTNEYCMLYALLGHVYLRLENTTQAEEACFESLKHYQTLITKRPLIQHIISAALEEIRFTQQSNAENIGQRVLTQIKRKMSVAPPTPVTPREPDVLSPILDASIDQHIQEILTWCMEKMSEQDFTFMVSTIDDSFWNDKINDHDVREFEGCVMLCYLSEQLSSRERSQKKAIGESCVPNGILESFEQVQIHSGLSSIQVLAAVAKAVGMEDDAQSLETNQTTLPERCVQRIESLWKSMIIHTVGYTRTGQGLTSDTLFNYFDWPGKHNAAIEKFSDRDYQGKVDNFLRDFTVRRLERDLSERCQQISVLEKQQQTPQISVSPVNEVNDVISE